MTTLDADIIIIGAGMVGATLASALKDSGYAVLILDRASPPEFPGRSYELRVSAVNVAAETLFRRTGAWDAMANCRISPMQAMRVWDVAGRGETYFDAHAIGESHLGHIIENNVITRALIDSATTGDNISTRWPCELTSLDDHGDHIRLGFADGTLLKARLVVGADGARSQVRELANISATTHDYRQRTLVATVQPELSHQATAWQGFLTTGPLAFLPLANGLCSLAWHADSDFAQEIEALSADALEARLEREYESRLGGVKLVSPVGGFDLFRMHANRYSAARTVLIGDAAHAVHPLAGLGANLGFMDAAALAQCLADRPDRDPGDPRTLRRYERQRRGQNSSVVGVTDAFKHVFGSNNSAVEMLRNTGLRLADLTRPAKRRVMRYAMGIAGDVPLNARR